MLQPVIGGVEQLNRGARRKLRREARHPVVCQQKHLFVERFSEQIQN
jgi:hypothetical protein